MHQWLKIRQLNKGQTDDILSCPPPDLLLRFFQSSCCGGLTLLVAVQLVELRLEGLLALVEVGVDRQSDAWLESRSKALSRIKPEIPGYQTNEYTFIYLWSAIFKQL